MDDKNCLLPLNRHLVIRPHLEKNESNSGVLLPDDFAPELDKFITAEVLSISQDCKPALKEACHPHDDKEVSIVVDRSMIEEIHFSGETHYVILENYILGVTSPTTINEGSG